MCCIKVVIALFVNQGGIIGPYLMFGEGCRPPP